MLCGEPFEYCPLKWRAGRDEPGNYNVVGSRREGSCYIGIAEHFAADLQAFSNRPPWNSGRVSVMEIFLVRWFQDVEPGRGGRASAIMLPASTMSASDQSAAARLSASTDGQP